MLSLNATHGFLRCRYHFQLCSQSSQCHFVFVSNCQSMLTLHFADGVTSVRHLVFLAPIPLFQHVNVSGAQWVSLTGLRPDLQYTLQIRSHHPALPHLWSDWSQQHRIRLESETSLSLSAQKHTINTELTYHTRLTSACTVRPLPCPTYTH